MNRAQAMRLHPAGKCIPESSEVAQARMDDEAMALGNSGRMARVNEWHHRVSTSPRSQVWPVVWIIAAFTLVAWSPALAQDVVGGWPA